MKKIFLIILLGILLIGIMSASDNKTKVYDNSTKKISVLDKNSILEAQYQLLSNECDKQFRFCNATIQTTFYKDAPLFDSINFFKVLGNDLFNGKVRWYQIYYNTKGNKIDVNDYGVVCEKKDVNCSWGITGTHKEDAPEWTLYTGQQFKDKDVKVWLIKAEKRPSWKIDWIISVLNGTQLTDWAVWGNISLGDQAEVLLRDPANNSFSLDDDIVFNVTINITNGASPVNMSLWTNETGSWALKNSQTVNYTQRIYDIYDGSVNASLWSFSGNKQETTDYIRGYTSTTPNTAGSVQTISMSSNTNSTGNISFRSVLTCNDINSGGTGGSVAIVYLYAFGTILTQLSIGDSSGTHAISSDNNFTLMPLINSSWKVYVNGLYNGYITPTNNVISVNASSNAGADLFSAGLIYQINYSTLENNQTMNHRLVNNSIWGMQACDTDGVCGFSKQNYTILIDHVNITIISPATSISSANIDINATFTANGTLDKCYYNITKGINTERANTYLNCSAFNDTYSLTLNTGIYIINLFGNTTTGIYSISNKSFTYSTSGIGSSGGGGGGGTIIEKLEQPVNTNFCLEKKTEITFNTAWTNFMNALTWSNFKLMWFALWNHSNCLSSASLVPLESS